MKIEKTCLKAKGYILISVLIIMIIMMTLVYILSDALFSEMAIAGNQKTAVLTLNLAEAGIEEAIWRVQNDFDADGARAKFLSGVEGTATHFGHDQALLVGGSYEVDIQYTAKSEATITSTALLSLGSKQAQRKIIVKIAQASTLPTAYSSDGAFGI
jgi:hypothetical protein